MLLSKAVHRLRPLSDRILPSYMLEFMKRAAQLGAFTNLTSQTSIAHLTQEKRALLRVTVPQRDEQKRMELSWQALHDQQQSEELGMAKLQQLKSALMSDLLTDRVRVPEGVEAQP